MEYITGIALIVFASYMVGFIMGAKEQRAKDRDDTQVPSMQDKESQL